MLPLIIYDDKGMFSKVKRKYKNKLKLKKKDLKEYIKHEKENKK